MSMSRIETVGLQAHLGGSFETMRRRIKADLDNVHLDNAVWMHARAARGKGGEGRGRGG